jgi:hypothetical protein
MTVKLNQRSYGHAKRLVARGNVVLDERGAWSEHQPTAQAENSFIEAHGFDEYEKWHLAIDDEAAERTKQRYKFPYGDFEKLHRCAVLAIESRAGQYKHVDVELAAAHLHGMLDATIVRAEQRARRRQGK